VTRRLRTAVCCASLLLAMLFCGLRSGGTRPARDLMVVFDPAFRADAPVALPAGFTATIDRATSDQFVRVVADDVDRDGDIDVVASLDSLDLVVWKNDGAGHFTRQPSSRHTSIQTQPPAPSVDGDPLTSNEWIQNGQQRGAAFESLRERTADDPETPLTSFVHAAISLDDPRARSSRAPPTRSSRF
jgi:hypothetical protein